MGTFDEHSTDAVLAKILVKVENIEKNQLAHYTEVLLVKDRVTVLEKDKWTQRGIVTAIGLVAPTILAWLTKK